MSRILLSFGLIVIAFADAHADELRGKVVSISDGDTVTVLDAKQKQYKVRLNGIDAPESSQDFGQVSKRNLFSLIFGKEVVVVWQKIDRYSRIVGNVSFDGKDINLEQLKAGLAWYFRQYERDVPADKRGAYAAAEAEARQARRGLVTSKSCSTVGISASRSRRVIAYTDKPGIRKNRR